MAHAITPENLQALSKALENLEATVGGYNCDICFDNYDPGVVETALDEKGGEYDEDPRALLEEHCLKPTADILKPFQCLGRSEATLRRMVADIAGADKRAAAKHRKTPFDTYVPPFLEEIERFAELCGDYGIDNPFKCQELCPETLRDLRNEKCIFELGKLLQDHLSCAKDARDMMVAINQCVEDVQKALILLEELSNSE